MMNKKDLQQLRTETAIQMCIQWPHLKTMILSRTPEEPRNKDEKYRFKILEELTKLEPSILHIIRFYEKRS